MQAKSLTSIMCDGMDVWMAPDWKGISKRPLPFFYDSQVQCHWKGCTMVHKYLARAL